MTELNKTGNLLQSLEYAMQAVASQGKLRPDEVEAIEEANEHLLQAINLLETAYYENAE